MDAVIERRIQKRLGRNVPRFDKKCGASGIPDKATCHVGKATGQAPRGTMNTLLKAGLTAGAAAGIWALANDLHKKPEERLTAVEKLFMLSIMNDPVVKTLREINKEGKARELEMKASGEQGAFSYLFDKMKQREEESQKKQGLRRDSASTPIAQSLHPQIVSTLKTVYGNGVLGVSNSKINRDGQIEGVFVGRSRPHEAAKVYNYGIDLVKQDVRFKRARVTRDSENEECCGGNKKGCECHSCKAA